MDTGDLIYVLIGAIWLIYSFFKAKKPKTTPDLSDLPDNEIADDIIIEQPAGPAPTKSRESWENEAEAEVQHETTQPSNPIPVVNVLEELLPKPMQTEKPTPGKYEMTKSPIKQLKKRKQSPPPTHHPLQKEDMPDFDLRKAIVFSEILKRPEY